jgi:ataxia telangiectasia mutated family protein
MEDLQRLKKLRQQKQDEIDGLGKLLKMEGTSNKAQLQSDRSKAKQWFSIDDREYVRLLRSRQTFLSRSLENYLRCLKACDTFNQDALRFCALWLENSDNSVANEAVKHHLSSVPSRKFAPLMNQLSSRLLDTGDDLNELLDPLVLRICQEHPYHGMYQIFGSSRAKSGSPKDITALARQAAALKIVSQLKNGSNSGRIWTSIDAVASQYVKIAGETLDDRFKPGSRVPLRKLHTGPKFEKEITSSKIAPPTMCVEIRPDCNYQNVPIISKVSQDLSVASGISAPKIITLRASNGQNFKQLVSQGSPIQRLS